MPDRAFSRYVTPHHFARDQWAYLLYGWVLRSSSALSVDRTVELQPIGPADVRPVAEFLHAQLNARITAAAWAAAIIPPWAVDQPNHGFLLRVGEQVVGAYLAFYSEREIDGRPERFCNLAAWCVLEEYRSHGLRLLRALLAQKGYHFTDFSPSGSVIPLNTRLKFSHLDVATALIPNLPWPLWSRRVRVISEPQEIERTLRGRDLEIYRDHARAAAARHVVVVKGGEACYVMFRKDRRKNLPLFASILYVGNQELFRIDCQVRLPASAGSPRDSCDAGRTASGRRSAQAVDHAEITKTEDVPKRGPAPGPDRLPLQRTHLRGLVMMSSHFGRTGRL